MLRDLLASGLKLVICGAATDEPEPYAGKNRLWETLATVGLTPRQLEPKEWHSLLEYRIGLVWLAERDPSGQDRGVKFEGGKDLRRKMREYSPGMLVFNGKQVAKDYLQMPTVVYGPLPHSIGSVKLFVCPSTGGGAKGNWDPRWWELMAKLA